MVPMPNAWSPRLTRALKTLTYCLSAPRVIRTTIVRQTGLVLTMYVAMTHLTTILSSPSYKGFYVVSDPNPTLDRTETLEPLYKSTAELRGSAQLIPRSKFLGNGVAILNFRLDAFNMDTGDLGKILKPFARSFFSADDKNLLIFEDIVYDLTQGRTKHKKMMRGIVEKLRAARWVSRRIPVDSRGASTHRCCLSSTLKTIVVLITTHAEDGTGYLAISSRLHVDIKKVHSFPYVL